MDWDEHFRSKRSSLDQISHEIEVDPCVYREAVPESPLLDISGDIEAPGKLSVECTLVGMGEECESTGRVSVGACSKCGYEVVLMGSTCGRTACPRCMKTWARRASERAGARIWGAVHAGVSKHHPRHFTFELESLSWDEAKAKAAEIGATGGVLVFHPYRIRKEYQAMMDIMAAKYFMNRYDVVRQSALGLDALEYSPHCHGIVYGKFADVEKGSGIYKYRNIRRLHTQKACERTLSYLLGHCLQPPSERASAVRYFGICSPQKLKAEWTGSCHDTLECPACGGVMCYKGCLDIIQVRRYIALGWHVVTKREKGTGGAGPPVAAPPRAAC